MGEQGRLIAALGYVFTPVVPLVVLAGDMRRDPFLRRHAVQALVWSGVFLLLLAAAVAVMVAAVRADFLFICLLPLVLVVPFIPGAIWARRVYLGGDVTLPVLGALMRRS